MKNLFVMLSVLALLGCSAVNNSVSADPEIVTATKVIPSNDSTTPKTDKPPRPAMVKTEGERDLGADGDDSGSGPLWTIRSEQSTQRLQDRDAKATSRTSKPQGPFSVRYVLEAWAVDDHRLVVEVRSNQPIGDWRVDLPQVIEKQEISKALLKPYAAERGAPQSKTLRFDALPEANRLLLTVSAEISGVTSSKTISVPLRSRSNRVVKTCDKTLTECIVVLPATISVQ